MYSAVPIGNNIRNKLLFFPKKRGASKKYGKRQYYTEPYRTVSINGVKPTHLQFNAQDYSKLCHNRYNRFQLNSPFIGNAVLHFNGKEVIADQYAMPAPISETTPVWVPLRNLKQVKRFGTIAYQAESTSGIPLYSNRSYQFIDWNQKTYEFRPFFSLANTHYSEPFWGSSGLSHLMNFSYEQQDYSIRGGQEVKLDHNSLEIRTKNRIRSRSQTAVMGLTALKAYQDFYATYYSLLTPELASIFNQILNAKYRNHSFSKFYPEWHHAVGYSLAPWDMEPQNKSNLGGGPQWSNTEMMVLEILCHWHASESQSVSVSIKPTFFMLFASEIIEKILYEATLRYEERQLKFTHVIEPHRYINPVIPQASDIAQITGITQAILSNNQPVCSSTVANIDLNSIQSLLPLEEQGYSIKL